MEQHSSITSRVRVMVLCLALFALFVIAPAAFLSGGSNPNAAEQKGGATPSSTANAIAKARLAGALQEKEPSGIMGGFSYKSDVSPRLRDMKQLPIVPKVEHEAADNPKIVRNHIDKPDPVVQSFLAPDVMPATILNFDGIVFPGVACNCAPPDTDGEVGQTQYVQMVNEGYQVFNKATGASVLGPSGITTIWSGFGGNCQNQGDGDPVVLYDQFANRWVISQFAGAGVPTDECIAVSTSNDATGSYTRYAFNLGTNFFDYPHLGVWPSTNNNGYYMSDNVFNSAGTAFLGVQAFAFDRAAMIAGNPVAAFVTSGLIGSPANNGDPLLPADVDGSTPPPANTPCPFVEFPDTTGNNAGTYRTWLFHPDFVTPANSTFVQRTSPAAAGFTFACTGGRACVPQPAGTALDGIADRLMFRLPYRIVGGVERVVGNYTVASGGVTGIRWFELRNVTSGVEAVFQEGTYQPDSTWRWMGSAAQDQGGNMALGFSASSSSVFPSVRYAGRLAADPAGTLGQGEATLMAGAGSQTGTGSRWGDYSDLTIDPVDDCTFWFTSEYYPAGTTSFNWRTRIGNFKFPTCNGAAVPIISSAGATLVAETCTPANGVLDPGETVTVSLCVQNVGTANTTALMGTLQATGGVTNIQPPNPQLYGVVVAGGPAVCRNFTFTAAGVCGGTVTATVHFTDGATDLGNVTYTFTLGTQSTAFTENFDGVTAPALPAGWVTAFTNGDGDCTVGGPLCTLGTNWTTVSGGSDTAPNHAFHNDPSCVTNNTLDTPSFNVTSASSKVTFRNFYNTESTFDGGVLEISINGGAFTDIIAAGGSFVTGGYNATISTSFLSPIAGRQAWSGNSGAYITTTANLPASANGQPVKLRFRLASDCSVSATGWNVDTISVTGGFVCATCPVGTPCVITCPPNQVRNNDPNQCGAVVTYPAPTSTGTCGTITCTPASGSFFPVGTTTVTCQAATGGGANPQTDAPTACSTITQSSSQAITSLNSVSCNNGIGHTDNSYYRAFTLSSFGISGAWDIQSVDIGVEEASAGNAGVPSSGKSGFSKSSTNKGVKSPKGGGTQPISVKLYTSSMPFPTGFPGSLTLIGQTSTTVADQALTIINIPVTGTAPAGSQLVVEVFTPDGETAGNLFFIGSNASPETGPSYLRAPACGVNNPTTTAALGFPNMHIVMNVNGCTQVVGTGPTCQFTVTVNDTQPPTITCPAPIFVAAAASCPPAGCKVVNFTATATDNCPGVTVVCNPPSGSCFPVGTTTVTCTATDAHGNTATCSFTVEVFSACLQDESNPGNVVLFNTVTGEYRFCCNGQLLATGTGVLTMRGCIGTIDDLKGTRKVHIEFDFSAFGVGRGTAALFLNGSTDPKCKVTDQNMSNNQCTCPTAPPAGVGVQK